VTVASDILLSTIRSRDAETVEQLLPIDPFAASGLTGPSNESLVLHACYVGRPGRRYWCWRS
jgi:hypothetical protein